MLEDIKSAKKSICLETYQYDNDGIGKKFREVLLKKAKEGVKIKLLLDAWGGTAKEDFFSEFEKYGAEVRFFREIRYLLRWFSKNHERNHRKLLIIDDKITYIGSANITKSYLSWKELVVRINGNITLSFKKSFLKSWEIFGKVDVKRIKSIIYKDYEIINDFPSFYKRITENRYSKMIKNSRKNILIITPYFIPSFAIRSLLSNAVSKGVDVKIIIPYYSGVRMVDILRNRYLGMLHKHGIKIYYYTPTTIHSKLLIVDDKFFMLGSSNLDYRSFIFQYEINFF